MNDLAPGPDSIAPRLDPVVPVVRTPGPGRTARFFDSDLLHSFLRSRLVVLAALLTVAIVGAAFLAPLIAPHDPYDLASLSLLDATDPPAWLHDGNWSYLLGTDTQGREEDHREYKRHQEHPGARGDSVQEHEGEHQGKGD